MYLHVNFHLYIPKPVSLNPEGYEASRNCIPFALFTWQLAKCVWWECDGKLRRGGECIESVICILANGAKSKGQQRIQSQKESTRQPGPVQSSTMFFPCFVEQYHESKYQFRGSGCSSLVLSRCYQEETYWPRKTTMCSSNWRTDVGATLLQWVWVI